MQEKNEWVVCRRDALKCLATADAVKVIRPGFAERHFFALICHTEIHWEDVGLTHTCTHKLEHGLYLLCRQQHHILQTETCVP